MKAVERLATTISGILRRNDKLVILTGAGISTDSGIPDYRGPEGTYTIQKDYTPITYQAFMNKHESRQRYWARSYLGYPLVRNAEPNESHNALAELEDMFGSELVTVITQNVDSLHFKAGSKRVVEMHGCLRQVVCMKCQRLVSRDMMQDILNDMNPSWRSLLLINGRKNHDEIMHTLGVTRKHRVERPDGDVDLEKQKADYTEFQYPTSGIDGCHQPNCLLKPDVVFFGENLKFQVRDDVTQMVNDCGGLLVIGSSLEVFSAFRIVRMAVSQKKPVMILNLGPTRADRLETKNFIETFQEPCGEILPQLVKELK